MEPLTALLQQIKPIDETYQKICQQHWDAVAKPLGGLGHLETLLCQIGSIQRTEQINLAKKAVVVLCADNGVVAEGISQCGQEVTATIARLAAQGKASVNAMAEAAGADVIAVDLGVAADLQDETNLLDYKIAYGTHNFVKERAMSRAQAEQAILSGVDLVRQLKEQGYQILATGEGGIGNTTTTAAVACALLQLPPAQLAGRGAGLSQAGLQHKIAIIEQALALHQPKADDVLDVLSAVGGFDIAGMVGLFLGGALYGMPIVMDGVISAVAALCAVRLSPVCKDYLLPSHLSSEPAAAVVLQVLELTPIIHGAFHLGEGTGAVALFPLLDLALAVYRQNTTFESIQMEAYQPL